MTHAEEKSSVDVYAAILVLVAFDREFQTVRQALGLNEKRSRNSCPQASGMWQNHPTCLLQLGVGPNSTERNLPRLLEAVRPQMVLCTGLAGALTPELKTGDIICPRSIIYDGQKTSLPPLTSDTLPAHVHSIQTLLSANTPILTAAEKNQHWKQAEAEAIDMEAGSVVHICRRYKLPVLVIKVISDEADTDIPAELFTLLDAKGNTSPGKAILLALTRPWLIPALLQMGRQSQRALQQLQCCLKKLDVYNTLH